MASVLLSGPAGASKTALARRLLRENPELAVAADFQSIVVALQLLRRDENGRYPIRDERILPIAEYIRRTVISAARNRDISVIATNSDGDPERRRLLLEQLGPGSTERIVDPGREIVTARLADPVTGELAEACDRAIRRWYR